MKLRVFMLLVLLAFVFSCQSNKKQEMTDEQRLEIAMTIKKDFKDMIVSYRDFTVENFEKSLLKWVESDDKAWLGKPAFWFNMISLLPDKESLEAWRPKPTSRRAATDFYIDEDYVAVISPECALYTFKGSFTTTNKNGKISEKIPMSGSYIYVLRNNVWKMLHMHQSWKTDE